MLHHAAHAPKKASSAAPRHHDAREAHAAARLHALQDLMLQHRDALHDAHEDAWCSIRTHTPMRTRTTKCPRPRRRCNDMGRSTRRRPRASAVSTADICKQTHQCTAHVHSSSTLHAQGGRGEWSHGAGTPATPPPRCRNATARLRSCCRCRSTTAPLHGARSTLGPELPWALKCWPPPATVGGAIGGSWFASAPGGGGQRGELLCPCGHGSMVPGHLASPLLHTQPFWSPRVRLPSFYFFSTSLVAV